MWKWFDKTDSSFDQIQGGTCLISLDEYPLIWRKLWGSLKSLEEWWHKSSWEDFLRSTIPSLYSPWFSRPSRLVCWKGRMGWRGSRWTARGRRTAASAAAGRRRRRWGWWTGSSSWCAGNQSLLLASYWASSSSSKALSAAEQLIVRLWQQTCLSTPPPPATLHQPAQQATPPPLYHQAFRPAQSRLPSSIHCYLPEPRWLTTWRATTSSSTSSKAGQQSFPVRDFLLLLLNLLLTTRNTTTGCFCCCTIQFCLTMPMLIYTFT